MVDYDTAGTHPEQVSAITVRLGSRCRSVFKTREFRFDYLKHMIDRIEKMSFVYWHFLASRILAEISSVKNLINFGPNQ